MMLNVCMSLALGAVADDLDTAQLVELCKRVQSADNYTFEVVTESDGESFFGRGRGGREEQGGTVLVQCDEQLMRTHFAELREPGHALADLVRLHVEGRGRVFNIVVVDGHDCAVVAGATMSDRNLGHTSSVCRIHRRGNRPAAQMCNRAALVQILDTSCSLRRQGSMKRKSGTHRGLRDAAGNPRPGSMATPCKDGKDES